MTNNNTVSLQIHLYKQPANRALDDWFITEKSLELVTSKQIDDALKIACRKKVKSIKFDGPVLNASNKQFDLLASLFNRYFKKNAPCIQEARVLPQGKINKQEAHLLKHVFNLEVYFQSTNPKVKKIYTKKYSYKSYSSFTKALKAHGIEPVLSVHVGLPGDTIEGLVETLRAAYFLRPKKMRLIKFPGTAKTEVAIHQYKIASESADNFNYWAGLYKNRRA